MVHGNRVPLPEDAVGKSLAFANGDRCQLHAIRHVAHRVDVIHIGLAEPVDFDLALVAKLHAGSFKTEPFGIRNAADCKHDEIGLLLVAIGHLHEITAVVARLDIFESGVEAELDALHRRNLQEPVANRFVIATQQLVAAIDDVNIAAELVEDTGKFIGDVSAACDDDLLRQFIEMERLVRTDRVFRTLALRHPRAGTGSDEDVLGGDLGPAGQRDFVRSGYLGTLVIDGDVVILQRLGIGAFEAVDVVQDVVAQCYPVELGIFGRPAEIARVFQILGEMRAVDQHLLGNTPADDTGTADPMFFSDCDLRSVGSRDPAGAYAPRPRADCEKIEIVLVGHAGLLVAQARDIATHRAFAKVGQGKVFSAS